jgi:UDP-glucose 4-epimerase
MNNVLQGTPMPVFGDGLQTRAFSHIADVAPIIARSPLVPESAQEVFNIGADQPYTILELAEEIAEAFELELELEHLPARNEVVHAFSDHSKVRNVFNPPEPVNLHDGIQRTAEWVKAHGSRQPVEFKGEIEVERNLPPSWRAS